MSDDIVTRLRAADGKVLPDFYCNNLRFAACYEIERLRELINHGLTDANQCAGCDLCEQLKTMHLQAVKP